MYQRILVPTDGSEYAEAAADRGFALAETLDAELHLLAVVDAGPLSSIRLPGDAANAEEVLREQAEAAVDRLEERAAERGITPTVTIQSGTPVEEILEYAEPADIDVAVMGTRGRGGVDRMVLGSVTDGVTRYGDMDVLVVDTNPS